MIKKIFLTYVLISLCFPLAFVFAEDEDTITDIEEQKHYEKGAYSVDDKGDTLTIKKGEGFDFKVPEILITGQIDTRILLKRETTSLESLEDVNSVIYEKGKIMMPYFYLNEEKFSPNFQDTSKIRDFVGKIKLTAGSYNTIMADGTIGKYFNENNRFILKLYHLNHDNEIINDRNTYNNLNSFSCYYGTMYEKFNVLYRIKFDINQYSNPYPFNEFSGFYDLRDFVAGINFSGNIKDVISDISFIWTYFDQINSEDVFLYKENRLNLKFSIEKDFNVEQQKRVKTTLNSDIYGGDAFMEGSNYNPFYLDLMLKAILYFEPFILQGGIRAQYFKLDNDNFRMSPYIFASYDLFSGVSFYAVFKPQMNVISNIDVLTIPFVSANGSYKPELEKVNVKTGFNINFFEMFFDVYCGYKSINDYLFLNSESGDFIFTNHNCSLDFRYYGLSVETLHIKELKILFDYVYNDVISSSRNVTYMPYNVIELKAIYQPAGWEFSVSAKGETAQYGTTDKKMPPYFVMDFSIAKIISDNFTITGYVNNILNNNYYLLYYYQQRKLNMGLGIVFKF
ncbi:MAG: TonB-dependent receptor [Candidatus Goldbacteria bacterium]|nr:TonB-dependent receptor [Candidatus Goldiibacteriota bacterium]